MRPTTPSRFTPEALESRQFLSAGALDTSFGANGKMVDPSLVTAADMVVQTDGKIVVSSGRFLVRYTTTGQLDPTFGNGGEVKSAVGARGIFLQSDGKIVVAGIAGPADTNNLAGGNLAAARYNSDGSLDTGFGTGGVAFVVPPNANRGSVATRVAEQSDGSVILAGAEFGQISPTSDVVVARLTPTGKLDTSFASDGIAFGAGKGTLSGGVDDIAVESDNRIVVADHSRGGNTGTAFLQRLNANGTVDPSLSAAFSAVSAVYFDVAIQPDGKILTAGAANETTLLKRYNIDGTVDPTFSFTNPLPGSNPVLSIAVQGDGKIVIVESTASPSSKFFVARLLPSGQLDPSFGTNGQTTTPMDAHVVGTRVALEPDGRVVVAGGSASELALARYSTADSVGTPTPTPTDSTPPAATILAAPRLRSFVKSYSFTITYHDNLGLDVSTLDDNDIVVTGPSGFSAPAQFLVASSGRHASTRVVTYAVQGPGRRWNAADDGLYTIHLQAGQVLDTSGNPVAGADVSMFHVVIPDSTSGFVQQPAAPMFATTARALASADVLDRHKGLLGAA